MLFEHYTILPTPHTPSPDVLFLPLLYPIPDTSSIPPLRSLLVYTRVLTLGLRLTHLLWCLPPQLRSFRFPLIFPLPFGKVLVPLVSLILFIISQLITAYLHHILLLFPPCLMFLFLKLCIRLSLIRARNRQWLKKCLFSILLAHET